MNFLLFCSYMILHFFPLLLSFPFIKETPALPVSNQMSCGIGVHLETMGQLQPGQAMDIYKALKTVVRMCVMSSKELE